MEELESLGKMRIEIQSRILRGALILLSVFSFLLATGWVVKYFVAQLLAKDPSRENLQLAIKLDPNNALNHLLLGGLYEYSPTMVDTEKAMEHFRRAAQLSPYDPNVWINLAAASEFQGNTTQAEKYIQRADYLAPRLPVFQWRVGNIYLLNGKTDDALRHFKMVLEGTREYDSQIFSLAWKATTDPAAILRNLIPRDMSAEFGYLQFLLDKGEYTYARPVWERIVNDPASFDPIRAEPYIEALIRAKKPGTAFQVWTDLQTKGIVHYGSPSITGNLVTNGDFEDKMLKMGFDWHITQVEGATATLDSSNFHSPGHALMVRFNGKRNIAASFAFQFIKVNPSTSYRLRGFMKSEGITTDSGPRLVVLDAYNPTALRQYTQDLIGSSNGWTQMLMDFKTGPKTELVFLSLSRFVSRKLDNLIAGKVWIDDVQITPLRSDAAGRSDRSGNIQSILADQSK